MMDTQVDRELLEKIADMLGKPVGAFNIRKDCGCDGRESTEHIKIDNRADGKSGIDIHVLDGTVGETCHIPVIITKPGIQETVYNDFKRGRVSRLNGLWDLCCSSAALDPRMLLELAQNGFVVNQCYGMTETFGDGILNFTQTADHMSAVGKPDDHVQYKLDETGEICIKGDCVMLGYYKDPEATAEVIDADGWFHTGDLARMDEEGFYYITGRKKNLIILASGENVSPEELEKKLALCPAITECIVKEKDQKICAVIYCPEDKQEEVRAFVTEVNRSLPLYKRISAVEFTAEPLPRNALGKLLRK